MAAEYKPPVRMQVIKDIDCTRDTPVLRGFPDTPIYGAGTRIRPCWPGKKTTAYEKKTFLPELLPLEEYDQVIVLYSGGKDSTAAYYKLRELGVPKEKIELWHHDVDGGHPDRRMDWPVTQAYVRAFAQAEGVPLGCPGGSEASGPKSTAWARPCPLNMRTAALSVPAGSPQPSWRATGCGLRSWLKSALRRPRR